MKQRLAQTTVLTWTAILDQCRKETTSHLRSGPKSKRAPTEL